MTGRGWSYLKSQPKLKLFQLTPEVHDAGNVCERHEDADEDEDGGLEVGQEEDGGEVDGHDGEAHVAVKLAADDLE